jgi:SAM-dependent methyltransferase
VLRDRCGLRPGTHVLEIGPGTGQVTRRLLELGANPLIAIEPDSRLAQFLRERFGEGIVLTECTLESAELESDSFDLAVAASMFHWVEEALGLRLLLRALRPGGWIALWWTIFGDERYSDPFMDAIDPLFADVPHSPSAGDEGRPSFGRDAERRLAALTAAGFAEPAHEEFRWSRVWDAAGIRGLYATFSPVIALGTEPRKRLLDAVETVARDEFGDRVEKRLVTSLYIARNPG